MLAREASPRSPTTQGDSLRGTEQGDQGYGRDGPGVSVTLLGGRKHDTPIGVVETNRWYLLGIYPCPVLAVTPTLLVESSHPPPGALHMPFKLSPLAGDVLSNLYV